MEPKRNLVRRKLAAPTHPSAGQSGYDLCQGVAAGLGFDAQAQGTKRVTAHSSGRDARVERADDVGERVAFPLPAHVEAEVRTWTIGQPIRQVDVLYLDAKASDGQWPRFGGQLDCRLHSPRVCLQ